MSPIDWAMRPLSKYADFSGRAPRAEYWWFYLLIMVAYIVAMIVDSLIGMAVLGPYGILTLIVALGVIIPSLAVSVRRLHDTDRSGWWLLIVGVPYCIIGVMAARAVASGDSSALVSMGLFAIVALVAAVVIFVFMVLPGTKGDNRFGPDPHAGDIAYA